MNIKQYRSETMAQQKKAQAKSTSSKSKAAKRRQPDKKEPEITNPERGGSGKVVLTSFILIVASVIFGVCLYSGLAENSGAAFIKAIKEFAGMLFGATAMTIPVILFLLAVYIISVKSTARLTLKATLSAILLMLFSGIWQLFSNNTGSWTIAKAISEGSAYHGGGIIGTVICEPMRSFFSSVICGIILICLFIGILVFTTKFDFIRFFGGLFTTIKDEAEDIQSDRSYEIGQKTRQTVDNLKPLRSDKIDFTVFDEKENNLKDTAPKKQSAKSPVTSHIETEEDIFENFSVPVFDSNDNNRKRLDDIDAALSEKETSKTDLKVKEVQPSKAAEELMQAEAGANLFSEEKKEAEKLSAVEEADLRSKLDKSAAALPLPYKFPPTSLLKAPSTKRGGDSRDELRETAVKLVDTLKSFGVDVKLLQVSRGPTVTRYELQPSVGVKVSKITNLADDIALNLAAPAVRIEAPIPGKAAIGIEIPNREVSSVSLRETLETSEFKDAKSKLSVALGMDITGKPIIADIAKMPHVLIAGATGSGKSVCINSIITSILYKADPNEVKLMMIDPKVVELGIYNGIPHLLIPVVTDPKKASGALGWAVSEMTRRYNLFADNGVRDLSGYNEVMELDGESALPQIVIIIDELSDLMMVAPKEIEDSICRLAQMARAAGMHLIIATQRPSVNVITGVIKANIPSRIAFAVSSQIDSRTILDGSGAEKLLGKGDMLFMPMGASKPTRLQGAFVSDKEVESVVEFIKDTSKAVYDEDIQEKVNNSASGNAVGSKDEKEDGDELLPTAIEIAISAGQISTSMVQRRLGVGYARAGRIIDQMEARGIISGADGSKPRNVLVTRAELYGDDEEENKNE